MTILRAATVLALTLLGTAAAAPHAQATGTVFYVSPTGSDSASGQSPLQAWRTLAKASAHAFHAGDTLLLTGTLQGPLVLDNQDTGSVTAPITVTGGATILGGVKVYDTGGITLSHLTLVGDASRSGVDVYNDTAQRKAGLWLSDLDIRGFRNGISIGGLHTGFTHVRVQSTKLHANRDAGLVTWGPRFNAQTPTYAHTDVVVSGTQAWGNLGDPRNTTTNSGNGIVLGSAASSAIMHSHAWGNGGLCRAPEGPVGIWTYDSRSIRIAYNTSDHNHTGGTADGDGFDLDQNVTGSVLEHNLSQSNDGAGLLVYTGQTNNAQRGNVVRWNTSVTDAQKNSWYGGITLAGRVLATSVYGNTVHAGTSPALAVKSGVLGARITGNVLRALAGVRVVTSPALSRAAVAMSSNVWSGTPPVLWGHLYPSVPSWTRATGQS